MRVMTHAMKLGLAGLLAAGLVGGVGALAANARAAEEQTTSNLVETFAYPRLSEVVDLQQEGIELVSGDGNILLVDCATPYQGDVGYIEVRTSARPVSAPLCFKVRGSKGILVLEVPYVYEIRGDGRTADAGHDIEATVDTAAAPPKVIDVDPNGSTGVGIGDPDDTTDATLLQLKVTG